MMVPALTAFGECCEGRERSKEVLNKASTLPWP